MKYLNAVETLAVNIDLSEEEWRTVGSICAKIISAFAEDYELIRSNIKDENRIFELAEKMAEERDAVMLAVSLMLGADARDIYKEKGISEEIYIDSMRDIAIWAKTCRKMRGHTGLYEYSWIRNFLNASIVRLHRLEFHMVEFLKNYTWKKNGVVVNGCDPVINIHIPEDGPLIHDDVIESCRKAYDFFGCKGNQAFVCESWLLYPGNYEFLSENSNIRRFMDNFDIIEKRDIRCSGDLWRVFGPCKDYSDTSMFPCDTELQRNMKKYLEEHDMTSGSGYGVFLFDGKEILR